MATTHEIHSKEAPIKLVTVYANRAEITRKISLNVSTTFKEAGTHQIVVKGLTELVEDESVRVKGSGGGVIEEVAVEKYNKTLDNIEEEGDNNEVCVLRDKLEGFLKQKEEVIKTQDALKMQSTILDKYLKSMLSGGEKRQPTAEDSLQKGETDLIGPLFKYHTEKSVEIHNRVFQLKVQLRKLKAEILVVKEKLRMLRPDLGFMEDEEFLENASCPPDAGGVETKTQVSTLLKLTEADLSQLKISNILQLELSYLVYGANWNPSYDWRMVTGEKQLQLHYFGGVSQGTQEDWTDVELFLSTSQPSVGGSPPPLVTKTVDFTQPPPSARPLFKGARSFAAMMTSSNSVDECCEEVQFDAGPHAAGMNFREAQVTSPSGAANATFRIARDCTIASDNKVHKVTIAVLKLETDIKHYAAPALSSNVYLQAATKNTTEMTLLPSFNVSLFLDGAFLSKTAIKSVAPGEEFSSFVGVDPSVRIERHSENEVRKEVGMLTKNRRLEVCCCTSIYNTKPSTSVTVIVAQQLPLSIDEKIVVKLLTPPQDNVKIVAGHHDDSSLFEEVTCETPILNQMTSNVLWRLDIPPSQRHALSYSYRIDSPIGREISLV